MSKKLKYDYTYYEGYDEGHNIRDLIETGKVIREKYPEYYGNFEKLVHSNESYFGNIMVTTKKLFDEYSAWIFDIFEEVKKRIDINYFDDYHKRVFGFIAGDMQKEQNYKVESQLLESCMEYDPNNMNTLNLLEEARKKL
ncbi:MAG: DUF4422 domain-containing protein [Lachnotalea sp.]